MTILCCLIVALGAGQYDDQFKEAADIYTKGDFVGAAAKYEQLVAQGVEHPALFYNLGNAYYRCGRVAPAIANYERALALNPRFDAAKENLERAVAGTQHKLGRPLPPPWEQSLLFWHYGLGRATTYWLAAVSWIALWMLLALRQWRRLPYTRVLALALLVVSAAFGASAWIKAHPIPLAVANQAAVPVHYGTSETETVRFELAEGDRVTVSAHSNGWVRVATADGQRGWAKETGFVFAGPPYAPPPQTQETTK